MTTMMYFMNQLLDQMIKLFTSLNSTLAIKFQPDICAPPFPHFKSLRTPFSLFIFAKKTHPQMFLH